jgi:hypothetical protein
MTILGNREKMDGFSKFMLVVNILGAIYMCYEMVVSPEHRSANLLIAILLVVGVFRNLGYKVRP